MPRTFIPDKPAARPGLPRRRRFSLRKFTACLALVCMGVSGPVPAGVPAYAAASGSIRLPPPSEIAVPDSLGTLEETFTGQSGKTVIFVQDAHALAGAQESIRQLLIYLKENYGVDLAGVEGAEGVLDLLLLKAFPESAVVQEMLMESVARGELSGIVPAAASPEGPFVTAGVEDRLLYEEGLQAFIGAQAAKDELQELAGELISKTGALKKQLYPPEMLELDRLETEFRSETGALIPLLRYLSALGKTKDHPVLEALARRMEVQEEGGGLAPEIEALFEELKTAGISAGDEAQLNRLYQQFRTSAVDPAVLAADLLAAAGRHGIETASYGRVVQAAGDHSLLDGVRGKALSEELESSLREARAALLKNDDKARLLDDLSARIEVLRKLVSLEINRTEWERLLSPAGEFGGEQLAKDFEKLGFPGGVPDLYSRMQAHRRFYEIAVQRDGVFVERCLSLMAEFERPALVLLAGGFHTDGVTRLLREKDVSYAVISPRSESVPAEVHYLEAMQGRVDWRGEIRVDNGEADLSEPFIRTMVVRLLERSSEPGKLRKIWRDAAIRLLGGRNQLHEAGRYLRFLEAEDAEDETAAGLALLWRERLDEFRRLAYEMLSSKFAPFRSYSPLPAVMMPRLHVPAGKISARALDSMNRWAAVAGTPRRRSELRHSGPREYRYHGRKLVYEDLGGFAGHPLIRNLGKDRRWLARAEFIAGISEFIEVRHPAKIAWYVHSGGDLLHGLLATNASTLVLSDRQPFGGKNNENALYNEFFYEIVMQRHAVGEGTLLGLSDHEIYLRDVIMAQLLILGVKKEDVEISETGPKQWRIRFQWRHPFQKASLPRTVYYLEGRTADFIRQPDLLSGEVLETLRANGGIDALIEKGPNYYGKALVEEVEQNPQSAPMLEAAAAIDEVKELAEALLKPGALMIGDNEQRSRQTPSAGAVMRKSSGDFAEVRHPFWFSEWGNPWGNGKLELVVRAGGTPAAGFLKKSELREPQIQEVFTQVPLYQFLLAFGIDLKSADVQPVERMPDYGVVPVAVNGDTLESAAVVFLSEGVRKGGRIYVRAVEEGNLEALRSMYLLVHQGKPAALIWALEPGDTGQSRKTLIYPLFNNQQFAMLNGAGGRSAYTGEARNYYEKFVAPFVRAMHATSGYLQNLNILEDPYHETFQSAMNTRSMNEDSGFAFVGTYAPWDTSSDFTNAVLQQLPAALGRPDLEGLEIVDIGSGAGRQSVTLARMGARVHAYDLTLLKAMNTAAWAAVNGLEDRIEARKARSVLDLPPSDGYIANLPHINPKVRRSTDENIHDYEQSRETNIGLHPDDFRKILEEVRDHGKPGAFLFIRVSEWSGSEALNILRETGWADGLDAPLPVPEGVEEFGKMYLLRQGGRSELRSPGEERPRDENLREKYDRIIRQAAYGRELAALLERLNTALDRPEEERKITGEIAAADIDKLILGIQSVNPHANIFSEDLIAEGSTILVLEVPGAGAEGLGQKELNSIFGEERVNRLTQMKRAIIEDLLVEMLPEYGRSLDLIYSSYKEDVYVVRTPVLVTQANLLRRQLKDAMNEVLRDPSHEYRAVMESEGARAYLAQKGIRNIDRDDLFDVNFAVSRVTDNTGAARLDADIMAHQALTLGAVYRSMEFRQFSERLYGRVLTHFGELRRRITAASALVFDTGEEPIITFEAASILRKKLKWEGLSSPQQAVFNNRESVYKDALEYFDLLRLQDYIKKWNMDTEEAVREAGAIQAALDALESIREKTASGAVITDEEKRALEGIEAFLLKDPRDRRLANAREFHLKAAAMEDPLYVGMDVKNMGILNVRSFDAELQEIERIWKEEGEINADIRALWRQAADGVTQNMRLVTEIIESEILEYYRSRGLPPPETPAMSGGDEVYFVLDAGKFPREELYRFLFRVRQRIRERTKLEVRIGSSARIGAWRAHFSGRENERDLAHAAVMLGNDEMTAALKTVEARIAAGELPVRYLDSVLLHEGGAEDEVWSGALPGDDGSPEVFDLQRFLLEPPVRSELRGDTLNVKFAGGDRPGSGNSLYLETFGADGLSAGRILLDAGTKDNLEGINPDNILLTHAHLDHVSAAPEASDLFPDATFLASWPTLHTSEINWKSGIRWSDNKRREEELVRRVMRHARVVEEGVWYEQGRGIKFLLMPASHILGANMVYIATPQGNLLYTGDFSDEPIRGAALLQLLKDFPVDFLWLESTYGNRLREAERAAREERLARSTAAILHGGGSLLIPAFVIGRIPELVMVLREYQNRGEIPRAKIFVDGQAAAVLEVYERYLSNLDTPEAARVQELLWGEDSPLEYVTPSLRRAILRREIEEPHIVLAGSGMLQGGASLSYLESFVDDPRNGLILAGWQAPDSTGRYILDRHLAGEKEIEIIFRKGTPAEKKGIIYNFEYHPFSGHAFQAGLVNLALEVKPEKISLIHGDAEAKGALKTALENAFRAAGLGVEIAIPVPGGNYSFEISREKREERKAFFEALEAREVPSWKSRERSRSVYPAPGEPGYDEMMRSTTAYLVGRFGVPSNMDNRETVAQIIERHAEIQGNLRAAQAFFDALLAGRPDGEPETDRLAIWLDLVNAFNPGHLTESAVEVILMKAGQQPGPRTREAARRFIAAHPDGPLAAAAGIESDIAARMAAGTGRKSARAAVWQEIARTHGAGLFSEPEISAVRRPSGKSSEQRIREHVEGFRDSILRSFHPSWKAGMTEAAFRSLDPGEVSSFTGPETGEVRTPLDVERALRLFLEDETLDHRKPDGSPKTLQVANILHPFLGENRTDWRRVWSGLLAPYIRPEAPAPEDAAVSGTGEDLEAFAQLVDEAGGRIPAIAGLAAEAGNLTPEEAVSLYAKAVKNYRRSSEETPGPYEDLDPASLYGTTGGEAWREFVRDEISRALASLAAYEDTAPGLTEERERLLGEFLDRARPVYAFRYLDGQLRTGGEELLARLFAEARQRKSELRSVEENDALFQNAVRRASAAVMAGNNNDALSGLAVFLDAGRDFEEGSFLVDRFLEEMETSGAVVIEHYRRELAGAITSGSLMDALDRRYSREETLPAAEDEPENVPVAFALGESLLHSAFRRGAGEVSGIVETTLDREGSLVLFDRLGSPTVEETRKALEAALGGLDVRARGRYRRLERTGEQLPLSRLQAAAKSVGENYDPQRFVVFAGSGDSSIKVSGRSAEERKLVFLIEPELLDVLSVSEILALLRQIATAPVRLREFYRDQLGLKSDAEGRTLITRSFLDNLLRIAAAEDLVASMA